MRVFDVGAILSADVAYDGLEASSVMLLSWRGKMVYCVWSHELFIK